MERMRAEEERRQLEDKLQAEALRQQMEELKQKEMEVKGLPSLRQPLCYSLLVANAHIYKPFQDGSRAGGSVDGPPSQHWVPPQVYTPLQFRCDPPWCTQTLGH